MTYEITKKAVSPQPVLTQRRRVSQSEIGGAIGEVLGGLFKHAQQHGLALSGQPFTRYLDMGPGLMTIEPGMCVSESESTPEGIAAEGSDPAAEGAVRRDTLPGGFVASTVHSGPYETLGEAYAAIQAWMESEGLAASGAPWEVYITDPTAHPDPADWRTEVCWPVQ